MTKDSFSQGEMPSSSTNKLGGQLRSLGSRSGSTPPRASFQPSRTLCMLMNDLREIRSKQADLSNAMRRSLPPDWWGRTADSNLKEKLRLGDRFKLCQVCSSSFGIFLRLQYCKCLVAVRILINQERLSYLAAKCKLAPVQGSKGSYKISFILHDLGTSKLEIGIQ